MKDEVLENTEFEWSFPQLRFEKVAKLFDNELHPSNLLDIGCGNGTVTEKIREVLKLDMVDGVDLLADRVEAPSWLRLLKINVEKEKLPYPDDYFEAIHCGEVLEHLYDTDYLLEEIHRVLSPTGVCVLSTPNLASWVNRLILMGGFQPYSVPVSLRYEEAGECGWASTQGHRGHFRVFTLKALRKLLRTHHFEIEKVEGWEVGDLSYYLHSKVLSRIVEVVDKSFAKFPSLAYRLGVVLRREK